MNSKFYKMTKGILINCDHQNQESQQLDKTATKVQSQSNPHFYTDACNAMYMYAVGEMGALYRQAENLCPSVNYWKIHFCQENW